MSELDQWRKEIDRIDAQIVKAINERYGLVLKIGEWKRARNLPIYVPEREAALLEKLSAETSGPMPEETLRAIYSEIMSGSRRLERPLTVACLGPDGTYSAEAARGRFGHAAHLVFVKSLPDVFLEVESGRADLGCVPVENGAEGVVNSTLDSLRDTSLSIVSEWYVPIHHMLLSNYPADKIECIYSHPQVLGQCRKFLAANFPRASLMEAPSSARAVELASRDTGAAALAGRASADKYNLPILVENVEDDPGNSTRFLAIATTPAWATGRDKTSFCFTLQDRAGALCEALQIIADAGLTMSLIESRPLRTTRWEYCFFVDVLGHRNDKVVADMLHKMSMVSTGLKVFGSYPAAEPTR